MDETNTFKMFTDQQLATLKAVIDVIIPPDNDPGGVAGGVETYLLRQFERDLLGFVSIYQHALSALDAEAQALAGLSFAELPPEMQETLLAAVEQGRVHTSWQTDPAAFFAALVEHCAEGFYSDPGNGGNRAGSAWEMIGFVVTA